MIDNYETVIMPPKSTTKMMCIEQREFEAMKAVIDAAKAWNRMMIKDEVIVHEVLEVTRTLTNSVRALEEMEKK
jgi:hypothetical protein